MLHFVRSKLPWLDARGFSLPWHEDDGRKISYTGILAESLSYPRLIFRNRMRVSRNTGLLLITVILMFTWILQRSRPVAYNPLVTGSNATFCGRHPIFELATKAQDSFDAIKSQQSKSLTEAVAEYKRRYGMPPPPNFDKWYEFAMNRSTVLLDEYDTIYHALLPFWSLKPSTIRARSREDLGFDNSQLVGISIRQGQLLNRGMGQGDWQMLATVEMIAPFAPWLPDMDLAFNSHDEPRVVVPHDELDRRVKIGRESQARLNSRERRMDMMTEFSQAPIELDQDISENLGLGRFNDIEHQETWLLCRLSCPLDSPARKLEDDAQNADLATIADGPLGLVSNHTAYSDICQSPSLRHRLGFFSKPNAGKVTTELTPIFSMSKPSSFQDIPYPSPWYYSAQTSYDDNTATDIWDLKIPQLYWRGGTTGGFSEFGEWHEQLRQYLMVNLIHPSRNKTQVMLSRQLPGPMTCRITGKDSWKLLHVEESPAQYDRFFNVQFTDAKQCSDIDCIDQLEFFGSTERDEQGEAWKHRYLLDMDGNAYSGRFYAFLQSQSMPFKLSFFREWHANILFPWVHYVPVSLKTSGYTEILRFFEEEPEGQNIARNIAASGQEWARSVLRNEDMEVYMFRLLLE